MKVAVLPATLLMYTLFEMKKTKMNDTKIVLTDKQIMRTELEAEKELSADLSKEAEHWKKAYEGLKERYERKDTENYHLRQILKSAL